MYYTPYKFDQFQFCFIMFESFDLLHRNLIPFEFWPFHPKNVNPVPLNGHSFNSLNEVILSTSVKKNYLTLYFIFCLFKKKKIPFTFSLSISDLTPPSSQIEATRVVCPSRSRRWLIRFICQEAIEFLS